MAVFRRSVRVAALLLSAGIGLVGGRSAAAHLFKRVDGVALPLVNVAHADVPTSGSGGAGGTSGSSDGDGDGDCDGGDGGGDCDGE